MIVRNEQDQVRAFPYSRATALTVGGRTDGRVSRQEQQQQQKDLHGFDHRGITMDLLLRPQYA
jgi:hypothetical protein